MLEDETINKVSFVFILEQEHRRNGFLNSGIWDYSSYSNDENGGGVQQQHLLEKNWINSERDSQTETY